MFSINRIFVHQIAEDCSRSFISLVHLSKYFSHFLFFSIYCLLFSLGNQTFIICSFCKISDKSSMYRKSLKKYFHSICSDSSFMNVVFQIFLGHVNIKKLGKLLSNWYFVIYFCSMFLDSVFHII